MFKQVWSMIHASTSLSRAKYLYGLIYGAGTIGSIAASAVPGFSAVLFGSQQLLFSTLPIYAVLFFSYTMAYRRSALAEGNGPFSQKLTANANPKESLALFGRNKFLLSILFLVAFMQISVGLMEYQFTSYLKTHILDQDLRTEYYGRISGIMNILSGVFQFVGSFLMIHFLGLRNSHFFIPLILFANMSLFLFMPTFAMISFCFVFIKAIDFSLFGIIREMLYIPLKIDEKFRAKAIIDVFAYRTSKAFVSLFILGLQIFLIQSELLSVVSYISIGLLLAWMILVYTMFKRKPPVPAQELR